MTGVSALAAVAVGVITEFVTDSKGWAWMVALAAGSVLLVGSQVWLSFTSSPSNVTAMGRGSVAAGGQINADVDVQVLGQGPAGRASQVPSSGVNAWGDGSVAAGGDIKGRVRSRVTKR